MAGRIRAHGGRVVDAVGDDLLAELRSVVDSVACAAEIQSELAKRPAVAVLARWRRSCSASSLSAPHASQSRYTHRLAGRPHEELASLERALELTTTSRACGGRA